MPQTNGHLATLSDNIGHGIAALLSPLSRASLGRAFARGNSIFNFTQAQKSSARVWDMIFKDELWIQAINDMTYSHAHPPNPTLVGYDLINLYNGSSTSAYIALLISDWGGDCIYLDRKIFASLREHDYDKETFEVRFRNSNIILNVRDVVAPTGGLIKVGDPRKFFHRSKTGLQTAVLYFKDENLIKLGPDKIGRVIDVPTKNKECIRYLCSLQLKFGDGRAVCRGFQTRDIPIRLVIIGTNDIGCLVKWRLARLNERSWDLARD